MQKQILSLGFLLVAFVASAQWSSNPAANNAIAVQPYDQQNVKIVSDLKGGAILVWEDYRNDTAQKVADIYAQRINSSGNIVWQLNGIAICTEGAHQSTPAIVTDSISGAVIVWQDNRGTKRNLYAQRIDSSGNILWAANGVAVALRNFDQKNAKVITDGNRGAVILWQDSVGGAYDIYGQHLDGTGTALWTTGVGICSFPLSQVNPKAQISAAGDVYVTWQDKRNGSDYDIYAQKLNLAGAPQWTANGVSVCSMAGTQSNPKIALDVSGAAIIAWQDKRNGSDYDVFAQRINASGSVQWSANGVIVSNATGTQSAIDITTQNISNGAMIVWKDGRAGVGNIDLYAQMVNLSGAMQWTSNGVVIANASANQLAPNIMGDGSGGAIIAYEDSSAGNWDIKSQRISSSGSLIWNSAGMDVGTAAGNQVNQTNILSDNGSSIYAFEDKRSGDNDIYAYKLDQNGIAIGIMQITGNKELVNVYPNPSGGTITFSLTGQHEKHVLKITDLNGNEIMSGEISDSFTLTKKLNAGIYFYNIGNNKNSTKGKFIIIN